MYQVMVLNHTGLDIRELVKELNTHHIVVINSTMRKQAKALHQQVLLAMRDWRGNGPTIIYSEFEVVVSPHQRWFAPTLWHSDLNELDLTDTGRIVERAIQTWSARGSGDRFLYTNRACRD